MNLEIPEGYQEKMADAFDKMDKDMDNGRRLGQTWLKQPDRQQRCQIAADKLLAAIETHNENLALLMGGYIASRMPEIRQIRIDNNGEPQETSFS
jgi:hypothetical protein